MLNNISPGKGRVQMGPSAAVCDLELSADPKHSKIRCAVEANAEQTWVVLLPVSNHPQQRY